MQQIGIKFVCLFLFLCSASGFKIGDYFTQDYHDSEPFQFQNEIKDLFDAIYDNDTERTENIFNFLESIDPEDLNDLNDLDAVDYSRNRIQYVPNRIEEAGYPAETHEVITDDGYVLHLFRIPHGKKAPATNQTRPVILLFHALLDSANGYIVLGPEHSLAFLLADAGYDVWLGNARGTEPSRDHVRLNPKGLFQKKYWSFSWHEMGNYDLPAVVDHILSKTNVEKISFVGYSQGTTAFLVFTSMRPQYNARFNDVHLMAPVGYLQGLTQPLMKLAASFYGPLKRLSNLFRVYKLTIDTRFLPKVLRLLCVNDRPPQQNICKVFLNAIAGPNYINITIAPEVVAYTPAGASLKQIIHYGQMILKGGFSQFNYDNIFVNLRHYGRLSPPPYDLSKITAPVNLYYSKGDDVGTYENALKLESQLPNVRSSNLCPLTDFSHYDYGFSHMAKKIVYNGMMANLKKVNGV